MVKYYENHQTDNSRFRLSLSRTEQSLNTYNTIKYAAVWHKILATCMMTIIHICYCKNINLMDACLEVWTALRLLKLCVSIGHRTPKRNKCTNFCQLYRKSYSIFHEHWTFRYAIQFSSQYSIWFVHWSRLKFNSWAVCSIR